MGNQMTVWMPDVDVKSFLKMASRSVVSDTESDSPESDSSSCSSESTCSSSESESSP